MIRTGLPEQGIPRLAAQLPRTHTSISSRPSLLFLQHFPKPSSNLRPRQPAIIPSSVGEPPLSAANNTHLYLSSSTHYLSNFRFAQARVLNCSNMPNPSVLAKAAQIPKVEIPASSDIVTIRVIDTTTRLHMPVGTMFDPTIKGHTKLASPSYSFLIEHERLGSKILFDLGVQKRWQEQAPVVVDMIREFKWDILVEKDVAEILVEHGIPLTDINAIVWR
jgi:hypothetical protein